MESKVCNGCNQEKSVEDFYLKTGSKIKRVGKCKECYAQHSKTYRAKNKEKIRKLDRKYEEKNKEKIKQRKKEYYENNKEDMKQQKKEYREKNKEKIKQQKKEYREKNKEKLNQQKREYHEKNKEIINQRKKIYAEKNKEKIKQRKKKYNEDNKEKLKQRRKEYHKERLENNINYKISRNLRRRINHFIKGDLKSGSAIKDLGCSVEDLLVYLEKQFYPHPKTGEMMTFDNHTSNGWHIDHIIPLSSFNLTDHEQFLKACHYTNLQPLWAEENLQKGSKITKER